MPSDYITDLIDHKQRVAGYMQIIANDLFRRAIVHDQSKFSPEEYDAYEAAFPQLQRYAYGTEELRTALRTIQPAIAHHYSVNDHHIEHFQHGINDMTLIQLIEMVCDWIAASERSQTDLAQGLELNQERFDIDDQLHEIIKNTVTYLITSKSTTGKG